jgi:hypothetical protein
MRTEVRGRQLPRRFTVGVLVAMMLGALLPATALATASANIRRTPGSSGDFTLHGSNGYSLYFKSEKGQLTIIASQRRPTQATVAPSGKLMPARTGAASESTYFVDGVSRDPSTIEADLGPAGEVSLTFQPSGAKKVTTFDLSDKSEGCVGATKVVRRLGNFVGTVSFHGENGYTTAEAASVPGTVGTSPFRNCTTIRHHLGGKPKSPAPPAPPPAFLAVNSKKVAFTAIRSPSAFFWAFSGEQLEGGPLVLRIASAITPRSLFSVRADGSQAILRPPPPFSGAGVYRDPPSGPPTWTGDLSVGFPGVAQPLTGEEMGSPQLRISRPKG